MFYFGMSKPENLPDSAPLWAARAIFHPVAYRNPRTTAELKRCKQTGIKYIPIPAWLDILADRQQCNQAARDSGPAFFNWINRIGLTAVTTWLNSKHIATSSNEIYKYQDGQHVIEATPGASYGYMYLRAYVTQEPEQAQERSNDNADTDNRTD